MYWYPVDMRNSAKELIPNHLTFFLFHHVALFPEKHWPKIIAANGMLKIEGKKMSKSKGNFVTFRSTIEKYGADSTRCALLRTAEGMDDPDWREENIREIRSKIESFNRLAQTIIQRAKNKKEGHLDDWLISILQNRIETITASMNTFKTHTAIETALFEIWNDLRWYIRRKGNMKSKVLIKALEIWVRLLAPFTPHICEELWEKMKKKQFVSLSNWPKYNSRKINQIAEEAEILVKSVLEDTLNIARATKIDPKRVFYYTSAPWKWEVYKKTLDFSMKEEPVVQNDLLRDLMKNPEMRKRGQEVAKFSSTILQQISRAGKTRKKRLLKVQELDEVAVLREAKSFLQRELNTEIHIHMEEEKQKYDPNNRAKRAEPYKPAIYIE
jgi:leucyl-tRNA synthetase